MRDLASTYRRAHNTMRNLDGLQPQEAFEELLKFLFLKQMSEEDGIAPTTGSAIRKRFAFHLSRHSSWSTSLWRDRDFHLSDQCLEQLNALFSGINFTQIDYDIRSAALREFLTPEVRKGLGIFLTPDEVVREVVSFVDPPSSAKCLDPACGSGTFLIEVIKKWRKENAQKISVWGADKNPRMLLIGELNLGHFPGLTFNRALMDSLVEPGKRHSKPWCRYGYFDFILTNPPFGVTVEASGAAYSGYDIAFTANGEPRARQSSEWLFVEQSLRWLKPGGTLAVVLPRSVLTNPSSAYERSLLAKLGYLKAVIQLPPETFLVTGAQTNTVVAFIEKYASDKDREKKVGVVQATLSNVGYDSTGRPRQGSQLDGLAKHMRDPKGSPCDYVSVLAPQKADRTFEALSAKSASKRRSNLGVPLGDLASEIRTGRTPPRAAYSENGGLFLIKVGNLTGSGINWIARDRNFIDTSTMTSRKLGGIQLVKNGDIVLTSSAHSPVYIAKKVDIITKVPEWVGGRASFVGEVMLVRPKQERIAPMLLLAYLRQPTVASQIQEMVRGQTAHLHADDLAALMVPTSVLDASDDWREVQELLVEEVALNDRLNEIARLQQSIANKLSDGLRAG
uniref:XmnI methyltransferase n=2 Tax=Xanthomonas manihotis TaxID=43353 RepID=Q56788_XANMN|nr:XmnI methyltransferase [Xanthomonas phaseoli pv. manihotis]